MYVASIDSIIRVKNSESHILLAYGEIYVTLIIKNIPPLCACCQAHTSKMKFHCPIAMNRLEK